MADFLANASLVLTLGTAKKSSSESFWYVMIWSKLKVLFFRISETDAEMEARLSQWDKYLEDSEEKKNAAFSKETTISNQAISMENNDL